MWKRLAWTAFAMFIILLLLVSDSLRRAGEFASLTLRSLDCRPIHGVTGPEDITVDRARGVAYVSATDWRAAMGHRPARGALYRYALGDSAPTFLYTESGDNFHPHGISFWSDGEGPDLLYVVNHATAELHTIEVFELDPNGARHVNTLRDPHLVSPNDVVAVGRGELYVTNDHGVGRGPGQLADDLLRRERGQVVHVRGGRFRLVASDLAYANGINAKADGSELYVAETSARRLRIYARAPSTGDLALQRTIEVDTGPDNIEVAPDGSLYIAAHPRLITFLRHAVDARVLSPSEVVRVTHGMVEHIYLDPGAAISGSSVAAPLADHLLIGAVFADHLLDCRLPSGVSWARR